MLMTKLLLLLVCVLNFSAYGQVTGEVTQKVYRDDKYSFSLHYPSDWKPVEASSANARFKIASDNGIGVADFSIIVLTPPEIKKMTPAEFAEGMAKNPELVKTIIQTGLPGSKLLASGKTYLSNREAFFIKYSGTLRSIDDETDLTIYQIITVCEGKSITLTCRGIGDLFDTLYFDTCKEIASGFVLLPTKIDLPPKTIVTNKRQ